LLLALFWIISTLPAKAFDLYRPYIPTGVSYQAYTERRVLSVNGLVNLNAASLNELLALPGFNEDLALRVRRLRPLSGLQDLHRLSVESQPYVERLIERLEGHVSF
jgi:DNA uptake protein ComE-like DNA-binding protein